MENIEISSCGVLIKKGELIGIIGGTGSGKTSLLKKIIGKEENSDIYIDGKSIKEYDLSYKRENIVCVFNDNIFHTIRPNFELQYYINIIKTDENSDKILNDFINYFKLNDILNVDFEDLSVEDRIYIKILSLLIIKPSILCIDDLLSYLKKEKKNKILNYIKENDITLFCVSSDEEDYLLFDKILVLDKGKKVAFDDTFTLLKNENLFNQLGLKLPFIYDINNLLKGYNLINEEHIVSKELIDILWK